MDEQVWCDLDLQLPAAAFWPALADCCSASFLAGDDSTCFGEMSITGLATDAAEDMVLDLDTSCFAADEHRDPLLLLTTQHDEQQTYSSSSLSSSKRSLSIDSAGTSSPFAGDDDAAIMRAMMAVLSSASPSSSESSSPSQRQQAAVYRPRRGENDRITSSLAVAPPDSQRPEQDSRAAPGGNNNSSQQVYHMMSERKRREKLNDGFQTLRSLLPPCSKKDKTTVLINAASYLKKLESEVSELEERNGKLERHVPGGAAARAAAHRRRAKVQISSAASDDADDQVKNLTVMVMVECDIVDLVLHVLERLRWMPGVSVLSVDADTYSPQVLLKAIASIKLQITDGDCWNEASFHEAMKKVVDDATSSSPSACAAAC